MESVKAKTTKPKSEQYEVTSYLTLCPNCGGEREFDHSVAGEDVECICGTTYEVTK